MGSLSLVDTCLWLAQLKAKEEVISNGAQTTKGVNDKRNENSALCTKRRKEDVIAVASYD